MATSPIVPLPPGFQLDKPATPAVEAQPPAGFVLDRSVAEQAKNAVQLTTPVGVAMRALELVPGVKAVTTPIKEGLYEGTIGAMRSAAGTVEAAGKVLGGTGSLGAALAPAKEAQAAVRPGPSLQDVWEGKGSAKDFLLQGTTSSLPSMIATLGGGAMAGPAGAGAVSYLLNAGDVYNDLRDKGIDAPGAALAAGIPITALDMIEPLRLLAKTRNMAVSKLVREGLGRTILKDVAAEALPEGAQQVIQDLTVMGQEGKGYDKRQLLWSAANAAVLGGLTGGIAGSVAHVATGGRDGASYAGSDGILPAPAPTVQAPEGILPSPVAGPFEPTNTIPIIIQPLGMRTVTSADYEAGKKEAQDKYEELTQRGPQDLENPKGATVYTVPSIALTNKRGARPESQGKLDFYVMLPSETAPPVSVEFIRGKPVRNKEVPLTDTGAYSPGTPILSVEDGYHRTAIAQAKSVPIKFYIRNEAELTEADKQALAKVTAPTTVESPAAPTSLTEVTTSAETQAVAPAAATAIEAAGTLAGVIDPNAITFEPIDVDIARQSPLIAFGLDTTDAGSLGASLGTAVLQARANPQARARLSLAAVEAIERGFDGAEIAATAAEAAHQLDPTASPAEITAAVQPFVSLIPSDAEQVQRAVETMRSVLMPELHEAINARDVLYHSTPMRNAEAILTTGELTQRTFGEAPNFYTGVSTSRYPQGKDSFENDVIFEIDPKGLSTKPLAAAEYTDKAKGLTESETLIQSPVSSKVFNRILIDKTAIERLRKDTSNPYSKEDLGVYERTKKLAKEQNIPILELTPEQMRTLRVSGQRTDYVADARMAKAKKLADLLYDHGIAADDVQNVPAEMWPQLAKLAGVNVPSADTRALVQRLVRLKEAGEQSTLGANPVSAVVRSAARYMRRRQGLQRTVPPALRKQLAIGSAFNRKMLTMRQLGWQAPSFYPLQHRIQTVDAMNRLQNYIKIKGEETLKLWQRLSEKHRVQLTQFALTAHEQSVQLGRRLTTAELDAIDPTLTPAQQATYDATDKYVQSTARSLDNALQRRVAAQGATSATGSQLSKVQNENFFPTVGFGPWLVHDLTTDQYYRTDTEAEQKGKKYALEASGHKVGLDKLTRDELAFASVPHKMIPDLIKNLPLPEKARVKLAKLAYKDVSGQATSAYDSERALAQFAQRMGNFIARAYHREDLHRSTDMAREVGDQEVLAGQDATSTRAMQEWLNDHAKDVLNPESSYQAVKSLLFLKFFWANAKQAAINLTQIPLNTFPVLSTALADAGVTRRLGKLDVGAANALAVKLISRASYDAAHMFDKGYQQKFDSAKATALLLLEQEGVLSQSYAPSIAALNHGSPIEEVMARAGLPRDKTRAAAHYVRWMTENGTKLFGLTEEYNRRVTALAAYDVGVELGVSDPIDYAKQMVLRTQGDYSQANRPEMFRGKLQLPYIFKAYQQNQLYLYRHVPGRVKGLLLLAAAVGLTGLPGVDDLLDLIDGVATKGRELAGYGSSRVSSRQWIREYLDAVVGGSEVLMNGLSRHLDSFADVSGSLGMGRVVPGVEPAVKGLIGSADKTAAAMRFVEELTGVAGSQGMNFLRASMDNSPDSHAFLRFLMPEALRQNKEAWDAITNKEFRDSAGNKLVPVDPHDSWGQAELLAKMMGFQSARVSRVREGKNEFNEWKRYYLTRRSLMLETVVASIINKDNPEMREAKVKALARFDEEVPSAFKLTAEEITSALEGRLTHRAREAAGFPTEDRFVQDWQRIQESFK